MSTTTTTGFTPTNKTVGGTLSLTQLGLVSNYTTTVTSKGAVVTKEGITSPLDAKELISLSARAVPNVNNNLDIKHPAETNDGMIYTVESQILLRTTRESDDCCCNQVIDEPFVLKTTIRHPRSATVTAALVQEALARHISAFFHDDGTNRFDDFMRLSVVPTRD